MEAVSVVMRLDANQVQKAKLINVKNTEVLNDVMSLDVNQVHKVKLINV
jgi:hypothetical protein